MDDSTSDNRPSRHVRRLVTVRCVSGIEKDKKHNREFVRLDGWTVHVAPKLYREGDLVVFFEIDSFLPKADGRYWDLIAYDKTVFQGEEGYRVRSRRVGNRISQGLVRPTTEFPEIARVFQHAVERMGPVEGEREVMGMSFEEVLGVKKYLAEMDYTAHARLGPPPSFIQQPAWDRAQNIGDLFAARGNTQYQITEKLDGWSMTVYWVRHGSR